VKRLPLKREAERFEVIIIPPSLFKYSPQPEKNWGQYFLGFFNYRKLRSLVDIIVRYIPFPFNVIIEAMLVFFIG